MPRILEIFAQEVESTYKYKWNSGIVLTSFKPFTAAQVESEILQCLDYLIYKFIYTIYTKIQC